MKNFNPVFASIAAIVFLAGCGDNNPIQSAPATNAANPADYLGGLVQAKKLADKTVDVAALNQAVQLFNVQEGRYPKDLQELTPKYVGKIPDAPVGYQITYDASKGEVKVVKE